MELILNLDNNRRDRKNLEIALSRSKTESEGELQNYLLQKTLEGIHHEQVMFSIFL